jgi:hypothetical protein
MRERPAASAPLLKGRSDGSSSPARTTLGAQSAKDNQLPDTVCCCCGWHAGHQKKPCAHGHGPLLKFHFELMCISAHVLGRFRWALGDFTSAESANQDGARAAIGYAFPI